TQRKIQLELAPTDLVRALDASVAGVRSTFAERGIRLGSELPPERVVEHADGDRLVQIIDNLLTNAAMFTPAGGETKISIRKESKQAVLTVEDSGIGIAAQHLERIFDLFAQ